jgi:hypothetical protein
VRLTLTSAIAAVLLAVPAAASARVPSHELWATVNICDTPASPNAMGVRAAMPGDADAPRERMYVRFTAQWYSPRRQAWLPVKGNLSSPWLYVGKARFSSRQAGWTFSFGAPSNGVFLVRAVADFEWRERRKAGHGRVRWVAAMRRRRVTRAGVPGVDGGDPPGTSRGSCYISSP